MSVSRRNGRAATCRKSRTSWRSEEHTSELQAPCNLVCRLLLEKNHSCGGRSVSLPISMTSFSASAGLTYLPSLTTLLIALINSDRGLSLGIYPDAPAL